MGLLISKRGRLFRVWSTVTDSWRTPPTNRLGAMKYLYGRRLYHYKLSVIELYLQFPHEYSLKTTHRSRYIYAQRRHKEYQEWLDKNYLNDDEIDKMYNKAVAALEGDPECHTTNQTQM